MIVLRRHGVSPLPAVIFRVHTRNSLYTSFPAASTTPRTPGPRLELDPALEALLQDADLSLLHARGRRTDLTHDRMHRELEVVDADLDSDADLSLHSAAAEEAEEVRLFPRTERKSPAASFGSRHIGAVILPFEMQRSILRLISEADKRMVHVDAARLFKAENTSEDAWSTRYMPQEYTFPSAGTRMAHIKARLARHRDGTAFASVVMPAQYAVVSAVLSNVVTRLGRDWAKGINRVIEWGSGTGAGVWAALHAFGGAMDGEARLAASHIISYIGIEKREGLTTIAQRLLRDIPLGGTSVLLQKTLHPSDSVPRIEGLGSVALSSFTLSTLGSPGTRGKMVREMWDSGADVIVIIDDASAEGFRLVADARELLLKFGQREVEEVKVSGVDTAEDNFGKRGAHVIAPCPHDFACPLKLATQPGVRCTFEQRLQRPSFVRHTKHAGVGEEDVGYAYVVVRRGPRPRVAVSKVGSIQAMAEGRMGAVGRWAEEAARIKEFAQEEQAAHRMWWMDATGEAAEVSNWVTEMGEDVADVFEAKEDDTIEQMTAADAVDESSMDVEDAVAETVLVDQALEDALRLEAYSWPRINFPPLKRSGHILIDACMPSGDEMRLTYPRSQGKQIYYDARKASWGDLFPHDPKHRPVPRYVGQKGRDTPRGKEGILGGEGALAKVGLRAAGRGHWGAVTESLRVRDLERRRERRHRRDAKETESNDEY